MDKETGVKQLTGISDGLSEDVGAMSLSQVVKLYVDALGGIRQAADFFGVNPGSVVYAVEHEPRRSGKMVRALVRRKAIKPARVRLAADVTEEQREELKALAAPLTWSQLCVLIADGYMVIRPAPRPPLTDADREWGERMVEEYLEGENYNGRST